MKLDPALKPYLHHISTKTNSGYFRARLVGHPFIPSKYFLLHRLTWWHHSGKKPGSVIIHHRDGDRENNLISNLEEQGITEHQRMANLGVKKPGTSAAMKGNQYARRYSDEVYEFVHRNRGVLSAEDIAAQTGMSRAMVFKVWRKAK